MTGFSTSLGATLGTTQAIVIGLLVANAPGEWRLAYVTMAFLNALPLVAPADLRLSLDARLGRVTGLLTIRPAGTPVFGRFSADG